MKCHEKEATKFEIGVTLSQLTDENKQKALIIGRLIDHQNKNGFIPDNGYGDLFDKYYEKTLSQLRILNEMYR